MTASCFFESFCHLDYFSMTFNSFWRCFRVWEIIKIPCVLSWSYSTELIDLVHHSSFLKFLLRSDLLLPAFFNLIKCNTSCQCASHLPTHFTPDTLSKLQMHRENDIRGGAKLRALTSVTLPSSSVLSFLQDTFAFQGSIFNLTSDAL